MPSTADTADGVFSAKKDDALILAVGVLVGEGDDIGKRAAERSDGRESPSDLCSLVQGKNG